jgi:hypothetical protein
MPPQRYYGPFRLPDRPPPDGGVRPRRQTPTTTTTGRDLPRSVCDLACVPFPLPRRIASNTSVGIDARRPSPVRWWIGIRDFTFEACSGFTCKGKLLRVITARTLASPANPGHQFGSFGTASCPAAPSQTLPGCTENSPDGSRTRWPHTTSWRTTNPLSHPPKHAKPFQTVPKRPINAIRQNKATCHFGSQNTPRYLPPRHPK